MRNYTIQVALIITTLLFVRCSGIDYVGNEKLFSNEYVEVNKRNISMKIGEIESVDIKANCRWAITSTPSDSILIKPDNGIGNQEVTIECMDNPDPHNFREWVLTVASKDVSHQIKVSQAAGAVVLTCSQTNLSFESDAKEGELRITSNSEWKIEMPYFMYIIANDGQYTQSLEGKGDATIKYVVEKNTLISVRTGFLVITSPIDVSKTIRIEVLQEKLEPYLSITSNNVDVVDAFEHIINVDVVTNVNWTFIENSNWIDCEKKDNKLEIHVLDNKEQSRRSADIVLKRETTSDGIVCTINQPGAKIPEAPIVHITNVSKSYISLKADFSSQFPVMEYGICYSAVNSCPKLDAENVNIIRYHRDTDDKYELFSEEMKIENLQDGRKYYFTLFATSEIGTSYTEVQNVTTPGEMPLPDDNPLVGI